MSIAEIDDPRLQALFGTRDPRDAGVKPMVRLPRKGLPPLALTALALALGLLLFIVLNHRRTIETRPVAAVQSTPVRYTWSAPPPLYVPPPSGQISEASSEEINFPIAAPTVPHVRAIPAQTEARPRPALSRPVASPIMRYPIPPLPPSPNGPTLTDVGASGRLSIGPTLPTGSSELRPSGRIRAAVLSNPSLTVAQGSLIPAVLETGFDSTNPGFARAIVSRDVLSIDGKNVLIPRGSRLIGQSQTSSAEGQHSVNIKWIRLIRPDEVTVELDSPGTDVVGRAGVPATVNTHLLSRIGDVIVGAAQAVGQFVIPRAGPFVFLPTTANLPKTQSDRHSRRPPTLKVAPGTSISVFVAHDLEFSPGEQR